MNGTPRPYAHYTLDELLALADQIGQDIQSGTADRYRRPGIPEQAAFDAYSRDHLA